MNTSNSIDRENLLRFSLVDIGTLREYIATHRYKGTLGIFSFSKYSSGVADVVNKYENVSNFPSVHIDTEFVVVLLRLKYHILAVSDCLSTLCLIVTCN